MDLQKERDKYFSQPSAVVAGSKDDPAHCVQRLCDSGVYFRKAVIDSGKGGKPVEIVQVTDMHFNYCDEVDEQNPELMLTKQYRKWNADAESVKSAVKAMEYAKFFDCTVVTGDTFDYLSHGAIELMKKYVWDAVPNVIACIGGHELVRQMQTGKPDETPLDERIAYVASVWNHDIHYYSRVLGDKVMIIALDNSLSCYLDLQIDKFEADLERAREENLVVLIFQHEPLSTGYERDRELNAIIRYDPQCINLYDGVFIGSKLRKADEATAKMYDMITSNADIIRGIFCGHEHSAFYSEIKGSFTDDNGVRQEKNIPQHLLEGNVYDSQAGHVFHITII